MPPIIEQEAVSGRSKVARRTLSPHLSVLLPGCRGLLRHERVITFKATAICCDRKRRDGVAEGTGARSTTCDGARGCAAGMHALAGEVVEPRADCGSEACCVPRRRRISPCHRSPSQSRSRSLDPGRPDATPLRTRRWRRRQVTRCGERRPLFWACRCCAVSSHRRPTGAVKLLKNGARGLNNAGLGRSTIPPVCALGRAKTQLFG
eukprot:364282-Chlamydomonas_euryale.AAC.29